MAEAAALVHRFRVGRRTVTLTSPNPKTSGAGYIAAEWDPNIPRRLNRAEWRQYRRGRDKHVAALMQIVGAGSAALVVEL